MNVHPTIQLRTALGILLIAALSSCGKYREVAESAYPDQVIYLPAAKSIFEVSAPGDTYEVPTPGQPASFRVDRDEGLVIIPLGVVRGGVSATGSISVNIKSRPDTVSALIGRRQLAAEMLPANAYSMPAGVELADGETTAIFELALSLAYLTERPGEAFAVAVQISSNGHKTNPALETAIVVFNSSLLNNETK